MLGFIGNFDSGLRIGKMCRLNEGKGYIMGEVSVNSSLLRVQEIDEVNQNE